MVKNVWEFFYYVNVKITERDLFNICKWVNVIRGDNEQKSFQFEAVELQSKTIKRNDSKEIENNSAKINKKSTPEWLVRNMAAMLNFGNLKTDQIEVINFFMGFDCVIFTGLNGVKNKMSLKI